MTETAEGGKRMTILRAAEKVFAQDGYHGTTMRRIAAEADVKLSLVVYHFTSKLGLFVAIFEHRQYVNEQRLAQLHAIPDLQADDAVEQIVRAFVDPVLALHHDPDDAWFAKLVLREAGDPSNQDRPVLKVLFDPMAREFIDALREALPGKPDGFYQWGYLFSVGALTQSASEDRVANLTDKSYLEQKHDLLRSYIIAALRHG
ncbi:TetR/AcrR family transcriptional regulator [Kribbella sp. NPDC058245]|uniref:TetR/AcrR family transcriptional regulator n=1 Tax=Kribbella sp. NPDC058245 TaxID=3346399 RepID=UPI0036E4190F